MIWHYRSWRTARPVTLRLSPECKPQQAVLYHLGRDPLILVGLSELRGHGLVLGDTPTITPLNIPVGDDDNDLGDDDYGGEAIVGRLVWPVPLVLLILTANLIWPPLLLLLRALPLLPLRLLEFRNPRLCGLHPRLISLTLGRPHRPFLLFAVMCSPTLRPSRLPTFSASMRIFSGDSPLPPR
ncbi:hypothetical protein PAPYR_12725 [Paratrimastix pyriformis]|uniref:Uncharacterized protein n=1 Tax=Paratrimastix pyriformis TaxID=342808 RepID=A0ABQ8U301_9EUKA|nr:hypothetical protein PAPYR_12725 [Paratrimastix pyriformis]